MIIITMKELEKEISKIYSYDYFRKIYHVLNKDYYRISYRIHGEDVLKELTKMVLEDIKNHFGNNHDWLIAYMNKISNIEVMFFEASEPNDIKNTIKIYNKFMAFV